MAIITGAVSAVGADTTTAKELFVTTPKDRLAAMSGMYWASSGGLTLATLAAGSAIFAMENPTASGKSLYILRLAAVVGFSGVAAATRTNFGVTRTTFSAPSGTTRTYAKRRSSDANTVATVRAQATAITGHTDDAVGDFATFSINHQNGSPVLTWIVDDTDDDNRDNALVIEPATALVIRTRDVAAVAGTNIAINVRWIEL